MYLIYSTVLHLLVISSPMILAEDCSSGEKLQNSKNCQFYWECLDGRLLQQSCGSGNVFSRSRGSCVALNSRHDDCTKRVRASTVEETDFDATLARSTDVTTSACSVGDAYRSTEDCRIYFECQYPKYVMKRCIGSQVFSNKSRKCVNPRSEYNDCQIPPYVETTTQHCTVGEMLPSPDNSCAYLLCDNRYQLQEKQCPSGQVFDPSKKQCVTKYSAKDECSPTYMETTTQHCTVGEMLPSPDNSCAYLLCDNRYQLQEKQCPSGQVFNHSKKQCVTKYSAKDECSPRTTIPTCTPGEMRPKRYNCSSYYLCDYNYKMIEKQCASGGVFSPSRLQCVYKLSEYDDCSQGNKTTGNCTPGELLPKPGNCSVYYLCDYRYSLVKKECRSGQVFSPSRKLCVIKLSAYDDCNPATTPLYCVPGEVKLNPKDCSSYFLCDYRYKLVEKNCSIGQIFSPTTSSCVLKMSVYDQCTNMTKPSPCTSGELLPKKDNCSFYFLCGYNYELQEKQCETGKVFSPTRKQCVQKYSLQDDCSRVTKSSACTVGEFLPKKDNCSFYFLCDYNYELQEKRCETGKVFSPTRKQCVQKYGLQDDCSQDNTSVDRMCIRKAPWDTQIACDSGLQQMSRKSQSCCCTCDMLEAFPPPPPPPPSSSYLVTKPSSCTPGEFLPKKDNCSFYFLCDYNYELQEKQCQAGKVFSPTRKHCVQKYSLQDDCSQVTKPSACTVGEFLPKKDNCSSYFLCGYNYELQEKQCEMGKVFSPTRKQCVQKYSLQDDCSQVTKPSPCTYGELLPKKDNCSSYFLCGYNYELQEKQCEMGKVFSPTKKQCVQKYGLQDDCSQVTKPSSCSRGELLPKKDNCSSYFLCDYNYEFEEKQCESGKVFSPTRKQCVQKHSLQDDCSQVRKPSACTVGEFLPKKDNCSSYFLCGYNYELQEKQCEMGKVFSPTRKQCVQKYSLQDDCSQVTKPSSCTYGELLPKKDNCSSYFLCGYNYELQEKQCQAGKVFSPTRKQCVQKYGLQDDCSQVMIKPSPCTPGEFLPKKENCSSYFLCGYNYELQEKQCQAGKVFSPARKLCVQKYGLQDDCSQVTKPSPCTPDELLPKKDNCSSYFLCDYNYEPQEKQCQKGKVFSPTRKQCVQKFSVQDDCSPVSSSLLCEPGKRYSDVNNCNVYYLCRFGVRVQRICPSGQHYSVSLESCVIAYSNYDDCIIS